jgi:hypothetical protein
MTEPEPSHDLPADSSAAEPSRFPAEPASPDQLPEPVSDHHVDSRGGVPMPPLFGGKQARRSPYDVHYARVNKRRDKIVAEIQRNRRGEAAIPTWVLALILLVLVAGFAALVIFS